MPVILDNPVINAYVQGLQMRRQKEQDELKQKNTDSDNARADQQLKGYLENLKAEQEHRHAQLELDKARTKFEAQSHRLKATQTIAEMMAANQYDPNGQVPDQTQVGGQIQTTQTPGGPGPTYDIGNLPTTQQNVQPTLSTMPSPQQAPYEVAEGVMFNPNGMKNGQDIFKQKLEEFKQQIPLNAQAVGAKTKAEEEAKLPAAKELLGIKTDSQKAIDEANNLRAAQVAQINAQARLGAAAIGAQARRDAAKLSSAVDPGIVENNAKLHAVGLGGVALGNSKADVVTKMALAKQGLVDLSGKDAGKLKDVHGMDSLYDTMTDFISKLPESGVSATGQKLLAKIPASDLKNFEERIRGVSGNIAKTIGGESGRLSEDDIKRALGLLVRPGITKEQAIERMQFLGATTRSKVMDQILGGMSDKQKLLVLHQYEFDPKKFDTGVQFNGKTIPRFRQDTDGEWLVWDPKLKAHVSVD